MARKKKPVSPIRQQYLEIKREYPNAIIFFRLGDFYETFDEDAIITSRDLDIVLTERSVGKGQRVPMAGIPYHAVENYLGRLIEKGHHVAICEQIGEQPQRGIFPRAVVRVVTPGTVVEAGLLPADANNYLAAIVWQEDRAGIAYADITTGEFAVTELQSKDILSDLKGELLRLNPAEILLPETLEIGSTHPAHFTKWPDWRFDETRCRQALLGHLATASLDGYGLRGKPFASRASGVIIQYLEETQPAALNLLTALRTYSINDFMSLDASTRRNLELTETLRDRKVFGSLLGVLDQTITPIGRRLIRQWVSKPLLDTSVINDRLDGVSLFFDDGMLRIEFRTALKPIPDLERLTNRIVSKSVLPKELAALRSAFTEVPKLLSLLPETLPESRSIAKQIPAILKAQDLLERGLEVDPPATLQNIGVIRPGFSIVLDEILAASRHAREWIAALEQVERTRTGIKNLKVGFNKVFGYYIEVTRSQTEFVPEDYIRKQTLVNAERYITPEMKEYEAQVLNAEEEIRAVEKRVFNEMCEQLAEFSEPILVTAKNIGSLDVLAALAESASMHGYTRPEVLEDDLLEIVDGRHPVVEQSLNPGVRFVPNNAEFEEGERVRIITGPNMSGKSTYLRQVALICLMAQMGSYVPAVRARIGLVDRIFTRIGAQDEIHSGQSTFMVEMLEAANILHHATRRSLLILDELGRGTSTYDGVSIAWAVVEYIHNHPELKSKTLFATHYHELTQLSELLPGVRNYNVAVSESESKIVFLHKIIPGGADRSYGIYVAQLAGLPFPVIQRANEILNQLEASSGSAVQIDPQAPQQMALFPQTNPFIDELRKLDLNSLSPIEALNRLYEWRRRYVPPEKDN